jgi:hypothetical protein
MGTIESFISGRYDERTEEIAKVLADRGYTPRIDLETNRRIRIAIYAYAYEFESDPIVSDAEFDDLAKLIDVDISTRRLDLDKFFREEFSDCTGQWIHKHPDLDAIKLIFDTHYKKKKRKKKKS